VIGWVRKTIVILYGWLDMFEFWDFSVMCYEKGINSGGLFAQNVTMFLKLKQ